MVKLNGFLVAVSICAALAGCKKKDESKAGDMKSTEPVATPSADPKPVAAGSAAPAGSAAAPTPNAPSKTLASQDDYDAASLALAEAGTKVYVAAGTDCARLSADLTKYASDNKDALAAIKAFEAANPDAYGTFTTKHADKFNEMLSSVSPSTVACQDDKGFETALAMLR